MKRTSHLVSTLIVAGVALLGVASCTSSGDSADGTTTTTEPISKGSYVEQANAICLEVSTPMRDAMNEIVTDDPAAVNNGVLNVLLPAQREQLARVRALGYPEGDKQLLETAYQAADAEFDLMETDPQLALDRGSDEFRKQAKVLVEYGLVECAD